MFERYVEAVSQLTGAATASLYVAATVPTDSGPTLFQVGHLPPVPELGSEREAQRFVAALDAERWESETPSGEAPLEYFKSDASDGHLLRVCVAVSCFEVPYTSEQLSFQETVQCHCNPSRT